MFLHLESSSFKAHSKKYEIVSIASRKKNNNSNNDDDDSDAPATNKPKRKPRTYIPTYRSGGYGILLCLLEFQGAGRDVSSKEQICRHAQNFCDASYTQADAGKTYTAFSSMKMLVEKGYVWKNGSPAKFCLTETGIEIARRLQEARSGETNGSAAAGSSSNGASSSRQITATANDDDETMYRNPSAARSASSRRKNGSRTMDILSNMIDFDDDTPDQIDMSLYVSDPSAHQSISVNGRISSSSASSSSRPENNENFLQALADASRPKKRQRANNSNGGGGGNKRQRSNKKSSTAAAFDKLLAEMEAKGIDNSNSLDMGHYVQDTSAYQSISLGNKTVHNKPTTSTPPSRNSSSTSISNFLTPKSNGNNVNINSSSSRAGSSSSSFTTATASSITTSSRSSFARRVASADDTDDYDSMFSRSTQANNNGSTRKYTTPTSSVLLRNNNNKSAAAPKKKPTYNDDEFVLDMTSATPTLASSQVNNVQSEDIVDLLSPSPPLRPTTTTTTSTLDNELNGIPTFDDDFDVDTDYFPLSQQRTEQVVNDTFHYTYLDANGEAVKHVTKAIVIVDEKNQCLAYQVRFFSNQTGHPRYHQMVQVKQDKEHAGCSLGYLLEMHRDIIAPGLPAKPVLPLHREDPDDFWPSSSNSSNKQQQLAKPSTITRDNTDYSERIFSTQLSFSSSQPPASSSQPPASSSQQNTQVQTQQKEVDYNEIADSTPLEKVFLPHEYEIILVVDSREIQMQTSRDYFQRKLTEKGIKVITRSMDLGDVIWIARKVGSQNQADELYLDYIVERKRLDDLVSSIKDGRFVEQKTRLKRSGSTKVIYVVEEYNREAERFAAQAIQTAMSCTQIIDGIYLKRTASIDETIAYLVSATRLITRLYQNTTLYAIPDHIIQRQTYLKLKEAYRAKAALAKQLGNKKEAYLINYTMFGELNTKSGTTTLHEVYLRMLMTTKGVNAERALSLMKVYPTPHALLKAFQGKTIQEAKNMVKDATADQISRRRWGAQISERLFEIWGAVEYPTSVQEDDE